MKSIEEHAKMVDAFILGILGSGSTPVHLAWQEVHGFVRLAAKHYRPAEPDSIANLASAEVLRRVTDAIQAEASDLGLNSDPFSNRLEISLERIVKRLQGLPPSEIH